MHWATKWNNKWGIESMLLFSALIVTARWLWYASGPTTLAILITSPIQGLAYSTYTISTTEYIEKNVPKSLHFTALSLVSSNSFGLSGLSILVALLLKFVNRNR